MATNATKKEVNDMATADKKEDTFTQDFLRDAFLSIHILGYGDAASEQVVDYRQLAAENMLAAR